MGAHPYWYYVKYQEDIDAALQELRQREFTAGRYHPVIDFLPFPMGAHPPSPGAQHASIDEAMEDADDCGTRSILDLQRVSVEPEFFSAAPLGEDVLRNLYGDDDTNAKVGRTD